VRGLAGGAGAAAEAGAHGLLLLGQRLQKLLHVLAAAEDALPDPRHQAPLPLPLRRRSLWWRWRSRGRRGRRRGGGGRVAFGHARRDQSPVGSDPRRPPRGCHGFRALLDSAKGWGGGFASCRRAFGWGKATRQRRGRKGQRRTCVVISVRTCPLCFFPLQSDHVKESTGCVDMVRGIDASALGLRPGAQVNDD
jgi:hypothetical protein